MSVKKDPDLGLDFDGLYDWRNEFLRNNSTYEYEELNINSFYELVFTRNDELHLQERGAEYYYDRHYNSILLQQIQETEKEYFTTSIVLKDLEELKYTDKAPFAITSPITYIGKKRNSTNARVFFGFAIDLDSVGVDQIIDVIHQTKNIITPRPNIIVNSGGGLHLYYLLKEPIPLIGDVPQLLTRLKYALTSKVWNIYTSKDKYVQFQNIYQGYRVPGSLTKRGKIVTAFHDVEAPFYTVDELNEFIPYLKKYVNEWEKLKPEELEYLANKKYLSTKLTLAKAKELYPEWYEKRIIRGEPRGYWYCHRGVYDWWFDKLKTEDVQVGHRYFWILALAMYAIKCGIDYEELERDAFSLIDRLEAETNKEDNHFDEDDVIAALKAFKFSYCTFPRIQIEKLTGITITPKRRNFRKQKEHLKIARFVQELNPEGKNWREGNGRKSKKEIVQDWREVNPEGKKSECIKTTGLGKTTVYKWWNS